MVAGLNKHNGRTNNSQWLQQIASLHTELLQKGNAPRRQFWDGNSDTARAGFVELAEIHQRLADYS